MAARCWADSDALQPYETVKAFADRFGCGVTVIPGEHFIPLDTPVLQKWVREKA
ncbi:MAG: hypothetical protein IJX14_11150 [Clostridia bacterium]|nr:hypothetical protein [Clostridia bacterium]